MLLLMLVNIHSFFKDITSHLVVCCVLISTDSKSDLILMYRSVMLVPTSLFCNARVLLSASSDLLPPAFSQLSSESLKREGLEG